MARKTSSWACLAVALAVLGGQPAQADYQAGRAALDAGRTADAVAEWRAAAGRGDARSMLALGRAFVRGVGVPQDFVEAHKWLNLAAARGNAEAAAERDALSARMTPRQIAAAQDRVRAWRPGGRPAAVPPATASAPPPAGPPPKRALIEAQRLLGALGYRPGAADGIWGRRSVEAYRAFLKDKSMAASDLLTVDGLRALRKASNAQTTANARGAAPKSPTTRAPGTAHRAAMAGDIDGLKAALAAGADANARDKRGWTALMYAANKGYILLVPPLLKAGSDLNVRAADGATALLIAALHGHTEIVSLLMKAGADISVKGPKGQTAVDVARLRYGNVASARKNGEDLALLALLGGKTHAEVTASPVAAEDALGLAAEEQGSIRAGLAAMGFEPDKKDGPFGPKTRAALRAWQEKNGRPMSGYLSVAAAKILVEIGEKAIDNQKKKISVFGNFIRESLLACGSFRHNNGIGAILNVAYDKIVIENSTIKYQFTGNEPEDFISHYEQLTGQFNLENITNASVYEGVSPVYKRHGGGKSKTFDVNFSGSNEDFYIRTIGIRVQGRFEIPPRRTKYLGSATFYSCDKKTALAIVNLYKKTFK